MSFHTLGLSDEIVRAVSEQGYTAPTPIQAQAIPAVIAGGDLLAGAQTGTGKTAGFTLPLLQRLISRPASQGKPVRALILAPTRELAAQVEESVRLYGKYLPLKSAVIFGGVNIEPQIKLLKQGVDILVATPGRLLDHMQQGTVSLAQVEVLVLDEADRMLDMGFIRDIRKVLAALPKQRQNLLFSATFSDEIRELADGLLNKPALIEVARRNSTVEVITQKIHPVDRNRKHPLLAHLIKTENWWQALVFTRTKHGANKLVEQLGKDEISALAIHGNKSQAARTRALSEFKSGKLQVLVATDIAARGIDIDQLPYVVNYDLPAVAEDYVHRIGRTGRAGATGMAVSLVCVDEHGLLKDIEKLIKQQLPREVVAGFEPDPHAVPQPIQLRSNDHRTGGRTGTAGGRAKQPGKSGASQQAHGKRTEAVPGGKARAGVPGAAASAVSQSNRPKTARFERKPESKGMPAGTAGSNGSPVNAGRHNGKASGAARNDVSQEKAVQSMPALLGGRGRNR